MNFEGSFNPNCPVIRRFLLPKVPPTQQSVIHQARVLPLAPRLGSAEYLLPPTHGLLLLPRSQNQPAVNTSAGFPTEEQLRGAESLHGIPGMCQPRRWCRGSSSPHPAACAGLPAPACTSTRAGASQGCDRYGPMVSGHDSLWGFAWKILVLF